MTTVDAASSAASAVAAAVSAASVTSTAVGTAELGAWTAGQKLAVIALAGAIVILAMAAVVLLKTPDSGDLETRKIRFAASTFTGILILFVFTAILYAADGGSTGAGREIFEKAITAMTPLAGVIVGYLFGTRSTPNISKPSGEEKKDAHAHAPP